MHPKPTLVIPSTPSSDAIHKAAGEPKEEIQKQPKATKSNQSLKPWSSQVENLERALAQKSSHAEELELLRNQLNHQVGHNDDPITIVITIIIVINTIIIFIIIIISITDIMRVM